MERCEEDKKNNSKSKKNPKLCLKCLTDRVHLHPQVYGYRSLLASSGGGCTVKCHHSMSLFPFKKYSQYLTSVTFSLKYT